MYLHAWLIGDDNEHILDDLAAPNGRPAAKVWIPLDCADQTTSTGMPAFRSAYGPRNADGEQWIDFALPPSVIREWLGPKAMVDPRWLAQGRALRSNVQERDGVLMAKVPRYFATFGTCWTFEQVGRDPLITLDGQQTGEATLDNLDLERSFRQHISEPVVIIDGAGPRIYSRRRDIYYNVAGMTKSADVFDSLAGLSGDTLIRCAWFTF